MRAASCSSRTTKSQKGRELLANPSCALHFFWPELERQVNIQGTAEKASREESETYFKSRPFESRIGAWASSQSTVIESRDVLKMKAEELRERYVDGDVPVPPFWGRLPGRPGQVRVLAGPAEPAA